MNKFKLCHKEMLPFKINLSSPKGNLNQSSIPIAFDEVLLYEHPDYRGVLSSRLRLMKKEFQRALGKHTFTQMCPSTTHLFEFMDFYHSVVMKTKLLLDNFLGIILKHSAVLESTES